MSKNGVDKGVIQLTPSIESNLNLELVTFFATTLIHTMLVQI